jgi:hypothetical protein
MVKLFHYKLPFLFFYVVVILFFGLVAPISVNAFANTPSSKVGPELPNPKAGQNVICDKNFSGAVAVINNPNEDLIPHNTVPCRKQNDPQPALGVPSNTFLRLWINNASTPDRVSQYADNLSRIGQSEFPQGAQIIFGIEANNLKWWFDKSSFGKATDSELFAAGAKYAELFNTFSSHITNHNLFPVSFGSPDLYNGDYSPLPWLEGAKSKLNCNLVDYIAGDVWDIHTDHLPGQYDKLNAYKYLEAALCGGSKKVNHLEGWGPDINNPDKNSVAQQVEFYNNTKVPDGINTAMTLIAPNCGSQKADGQTWWYYVDGKVYQADGTEVDPTSCSSTPTNGSHSCREFCQGTIDEPCKYTPKKDCSFPFEPSEVLDQNLTDTKKITEIDNYLFQYLQRAQTSTGSKFSLRVHADNQSVCASATNLNIINRCKSATGEAQQTVTAGKNYSTFIPPVNNSSNRNDYTTKFLYKSQGQDLFGSGVLQKMDDPFEWWKKMAALQDLKESCYQRGRVIDWVSTPLFGSVRCINYMEWPAGSQNGCADCGYLSDERKVFRDPGPLKSCLSIATATDEKAKTLAYLKCQSDFKSLPPHLQTRISSLPYYPIATMPIISANDSYVSNDDPKKNEGQYNEYARTNSYLKQDLSLFNPTEMFKTQYTITTVVVGQESFLATKFTNNYLMPPQIVAQQNFEPKLDTLNIIYQLIHSGPGNFYKSLFSADRPFWITHAPKMDLQDPVTTAASLLRGDFRFAYINFFLNREESYSKCAVNAKDIDRAVKQRELTLFGAVDQVFKFLIEPGKTVDLIKLYRPDEGGIDKTDYDLQRFITCDIYPISLSQSDQLAADITRIFTPPDQLGRINQVLDRSVPKSVTSIIGNGEVKPPAGPECLNSERTDPKDNRPYCCDYKNEPGCTDKSLLVPLTKNTFHTEAQSGVVLSNNKEACDPTQDNRFCTTYQGGLDLIGVGHEVAFKNLMPENLASKCDYLFQFQSNPSSCRALTPTSPNPSTTPNSNNCIEVWVTPQIAQQYANEIHTNLPNQQYSSASFAGWDAYYSGYLSGSTQFLFSNQCSGGSLCYNYILNHVLASPSHINPYLAIAISLNETGGLKSTDPNGDNIKHFGCDPFDVLHVSPSITDKMNCMIGTFDAYKSQNKSDNDAMISYGYSNGVKNTNINKIIDLLSNHTYQGVCH